MRIINAQQLVIKSVEKSDVILKMEYCFRSVGIGESEID